MQQGSRLRANLPHRLLQFQVQLLRAERKDHLYAQPLPDFTPPLVIAVDEAELVYSSVEEGLSACLLLLITGGVSVGDYDVDPATLDRAGDKLAF